QQLVAPGLRDRAVELDVRVEEVGAPPRGAHRLDTLLEPGVVLAGRVARREPRRRDLDTLPVFLQVLVADAGVLDPVAEEPLEVVAARNGDDRLAALVTPQQSAARELGDRLADDGAADVERLRELRGRRERVAGMQAALAAQ